MAKKEKLAGKTTEKPPPIKSVSEFMEWVGGLEGGLILFRGLASSRYEVTSSAERRIKTPHAVLSYTKNLIDRAKDKRLHKQNEELTDLELLAELQHYGAATCLIDFTKNPLVALWFACRMENGNEQASDGRVIAMRTDDVDRFKIVNDKQLKENQVDDFFGEGGLWKWTPWQQNNRVIAQQAVFVFGLTDLSKEPCLSIGIEAKAKDKICKELDKDFGINEEYLFSDLDGFAAANAYDKPYRLKNAKENFDLAKMYAQASQFELAIEYYDEAIAQNPRYADAYYNRGNLKMEVKKFESAMENFNVALKWNPQYAAAYVSRGNLHRHLNKLESAIADYGEAIAIVERGLDSGNPHGYSEDQRKDLNDFFRDDILSIYYYLRARAKRESGKYSEAIKDYGQSINFKQENALAYFERGLAREKERNETDARNDFEEAFKLDPSLRPKEE